MKEKQQENLEAIRLAIRKEFIDRCRRNRAYSLRAFAKYLEIDQSFLSKLLKGQRPVTENLAKTIGPKLGIKTSQIKTLFNLGAAAMPNFLNLSDDEFEMLSEWHHFAILELVKTKGFVNDAQKISTRLQVHVTWVCEALERLQRLRFIQINGKRIKLLSPNNTWSNTQQTTAARKKMQRTLLEKSIEAIDHVPFEERENGSLTVAINSKRLPEFKLKLQQVRRELADFFQQDAEKGLDEVYQFTMAFYPLTRKISDAEEPK